MAQDQKVPMINNTLLKQINLVLPYEQEMFALLLYATWVSLYHEY
jgi:hypothetical protein